MSQLDDASQQFQAPTGTTKGLGRRFDWAILVVLLAVSCTLGWIYLWFWAAVQALHLALS